MPRPKSGSPKYVKMSITLRQELATMIEVVMDANNIDRSSAIAMMLSRVNIKDLLPPGYTPAEPTQKEEPPGDNR